jgi:hypothetical protein
MADDLRHEGGKQYCAHKYNLQQLRKHPYRNSVPLFLLHTMPFRKEIHCTAQIQRKVGLQEPNCMVPRTGHRTRVGVHAHDIISCNSHMQPLTQVDADNLYRAIPEDIKNDPQDANLARAISLLGQNAGRGTPPGCKRLLPNDQAEQEPVTYYLSPGSPIFKEKSQGVQFIAFVNVNMDDTHAVKWYDLTGREQFEWFTCWNDNNKTYQRVDGSLGLRGTDPDRITTRDELRAAMTRSPGLARRRPRGHSVRRDDWYAIEDLVRVLFD